MVPGRGLEPPRCYPLVPETSASTNSATRAGCEERRCQDRKARRNVRRAPHPVKLSGCAGRGFMPPIVATTLLLIASNVFMTFAWYAHLKNLGGRPWYIAALASWGIALFEYLLQVPANRIGYTQFSLGQLKILQKIITLAVFVPFVVLYMGKSLKLDYLWAGLCMIGAAYFIFRSARRIMSGRLSAGAMAS